MAEAKLMFLRKAETKLVFLRMKKAEAIVVVSE